jgi:uncharacterized damage-inducible protein DinB
MSETPLTPNEADLLRHHFSERFRHDWWANDTLLTFLEQQPGVRRTAAYEAGLQEACHLFGHLVATELLWLGRVESSEDVAVPVWGTREPSKLRALLGQARSKWKALLDSLAPSDCWRVVTYRNTTGQTYENTLIQIIAHVLNHSTHHRAQVLAVLRDLELEPPGLDYIVYLRLPRADR